jgi:hypothetical protein
MLARFAITILAVVLIAGSAFADTTATATAHVYVVVDQNIAVTVLTPNVDLFSIQTGEFPGTVRFRIDANTEAVGISVAPTYLYKGDDPTNTAVLPILLASDFGALIEPTNANPIAGGSNEAPYEFTYNYNGFIGLQSIFIIFESSQPGYFSQDVFVTVYWNQPDEEKPQGEYSGYVTLWAAVATL